MVIGPEFHERFTKETIYTLMNIIGQKLIKIVEDIFGIKGKNDVAFTVVPAIHTINEAPIQIEIKYTVGEDEYGKGEPFEPSKEQKELLAQEIQKIMAKYPPQPCSASVWIRPQRESVFKSA